MNMVLQNVILLYFNIFTFVACKKYIEYPHFPCAVGNVVDNDCNYCVCNNKFVYECYDKPCDVSAQNAVSQEEQHCQPRVVYVREDVVCICNKHGKWPHAKCNKAFQTLHTKKSTNLKRCQPHSYVKIDCNMCRCNSKGEIDQDYCTKNNCTQIYINTPRKALPIPQNVHGHCEPKNWYSLAPCQFCFCINTNKLVCNTADFYVNKLQLGKYNLNVCGKNLIREAIELIPVESNNSLRGHDGKKTTTTSAPVPITRMTTKTTTKSNAVNNLPMIVREVITHKKVNDDLDGSTEYYDTEEDQKLKPDTYKSHLAISDFKTDNHPKGNSLLLENAVNFEKKFNAYDEEEDLNDYPLSRYANVKANNANPAINVDKIIINVDKTNKTSPQKVLRDRKGEDNYVLDVFVPNVLESLFNMQMRKSMVKVDGKSNCVPGTKETVGCNTCFCLNNGNKICTDNVCQ